MKALMVAVALVTISAATAGEAPAFQEKFEVTAKDWTSSGRGTYFILEPGYALTLEGEDDGEKEKLVITVLSETKVVDGVETRIVEEREWKNGKLVEVSRNFFALSKSDRSLYYFGEEVDNYKGEKISDHGGAWASGLKGARFGLWLPGAPKVGQRYYEEIAPGEALDRAEVKSVTAAFETPAGKFMNCLELEETSGLKKNEKESKFFAPGVGPVMDGVMKLVKITDPSKTSK